MKRPKPTLKCRGLGRGCRLCSGFSLTPKATSAWSASDPDLRGTGPPGAGVTNSEPRSAPGEPARRASSAARGLDSLWRGRWQLGRGPGARARRRDTDPTPEGAGHPAGVRDGRPLPLRLASMLGSSCGHTAGTWGVPFGPSRGRHGSPLQRLGEKRAGGRGGAAAGAWRAAGGWGRAPRRRIVTSSHRDAPRGPALWVRGERRTGGRRGEALACGSAALLPAGTPPPAPGRPCRCGTSGKTSRPHRASVSPGSRLSSG